MDFMLAVKILGLILVATAGHRTFAQDNLTELCLPGNPNNLNLALTGMHGTLQSPLFLYPPRLTCEWLLTVPEGNIVELGFDRLDLEPKGDEGCKDYVQVHDGDSMEGHLIGSYCGNKISPAVKSSGRYMYVRFQSDKWRSGPYRGFKASFRALKTHGHHTAMLIGMVVVITALACVIFIYFTKQYIASKRKSTKKALVPPTTQSEVEGNSSSPFPTAGYAHISSIEEDPKAVDQEAEEPEAPPPQYPEKESVPLFPVSTP